MMKLAFPTTPTGRYRVGLALGTTLSLVLMLREDTEGYGIAVGVLTIGLGLLFAAVLAIKYLRQDSVAFLDGGLHPSHGLLSNVPRTPAQIALRLVLYGMCLLGTGWGMNVSLTGDPFDQVMAGGGFICFASLISLDLLMWPFVWRWGATPPRHVAMGFVALATAAMLATGVIAANFVLDHLATLIKLQPEWGALRWLPVFVTLVMVLSLWQREVLVTRWQARMEVQSRKVEEAQVARRLAEAQLALLQAQIEPHFLYNTLASVQYLVGKDATAASFLLTQLIRYLRHAMPKLRQPMSTLAQEFELADAYLQIARMRMGGRLTVSLELLEALHDTPFPPLVLQTLVENALKHGVEPKAGLVHVTVQARRDTAGLVISVSDDGVGLGHGHLTAGTGTGLANIRSRLQEIYGEGARLSVKANGEGGVTSVVLLPEAATAATEPGEQR